MNKLKALDIAQQRRVKLIQLLRRDWWMSLDYLAYKLKIEDEILRRDINSLKASEVIEMQQELDISSRKANGGSGSSIAGVRKTIVRLTEAGKEMKSDLNEAMVMQNRDLTEVIGEADIQEQLE